MFPSVHANEQLWRVAVAFIIGWNEEMQNRPVIISPQSGAILTEIRLMSHI